MTKPNNNRLQAFGRSLRGALQVLVSNDPLRLAGATAFFTTFALPFILIILIQLLSLLFNRGDISTEMFDRMSSVLGEESMRQVVVTIRGFRGLVESWWAVTAGSLFMLFVVTTLFRVIRNSVNQLWMIRVDPDHAFRISMIGRLYSLLLVLVIAVLFLAGGVLEGLQVVLGKYINELLPGSGIFLSGLLSYLISVFITAIWFALLFRFVPDGRVSWPACITGALLTSFLFSIGKLLLKHLLVDSHLEIVFGRSAPYVLVLLFVFYSAMILYFGASFTKVWATETRSHIGLLPHSEFYIYGKKVAEIETENFGDEAMAN
ncbi:YihY/virulence factor BrkB family protein [Sediminibacterium soli]|uniref:YihY/virulence factor BrkB family protein n=1 Tax=Sediminibacterium soli TaxID=2698829 RepID=UPI001379CDCB|nr:YihY/virulence factor BrkB family protein [Sediminibacterium soli]NCI46143.1 YihY/virulence factor BrkB family protein [Sediminibacterium soli]